MGAADEWIECWRAAKRWRRSVDSVLRRLDLTLTQWLVLDSIAAIYGETRDPVSQVQVGKRLELAAATISEAMDRLVDRGLVDRAPAYPTPENRTYLTRDGERLAAQGRAVVEAVSEQMS